MLTHLEPQDPENGKKKGSAKYPVKRKIFWPDRVVGGWGGGPSLLRRGEKRRSAMPRPGGPWPEYTAAAPAADPPPVHPRPTIIVVIYSVFCVRCSKNIVFYRVLWPWPSPGFISAT